MSDKFLDKDDIIKGLELLDEKARANGKLIDIAVYGGAALSLVFHMREITRDVDVAIKGDTTYIRKAASEIAQELDWPEDWLNDGVKGFLSAREELEGLPGFQGEGGSGLRVYTPSPSYLFAMKCMAMRPEGIDGSSDITDIEGLAGILGIVTPEEAMQIVESFYPREQIPAKVSFGIEEIMDNVALRKKPTPRP